MLPRLLTNEELMVRLETIRGSLSQTKTVFITLEGEKYQVEYLTIPALTEEGAAKPPIFIYPGGGTHLVPCFEMAIYLSRKIIVISPLGYGGSDDIPSRIYRDYPLHGAEVGLQVLVALEERVAEIVVHSNAGTIGQQMVILAERFGVEIVGITFINPLALRYVPRSLAALAFPLSGMLTRLLSWGHEHPYKRLRDAYQPSKKRSVGFKSLFGKLCNSLWKMWYELSKSSKAQLPEMFREMQKKNLEVPVTVIQSNWDWASFHLPWTKSNREILWENVPSHLLQIAYIQGLHNVTLGKDSKYLAKVLGGSVWILPLTVIFLPQLPFCLDWLARTFGLTYGFLG